MPKTTMAIKPNTTPRRLGLFNSLVVLGVAVAGRTVVGAVAWLIPASVRCGRTLVSISLDAPLEPNFAVPASLLTEPESLISVVPSTRQNLSASSVSTRLHRGQRFILSSAHNFTCLCVQPHDFAFLNE